MIQRPRQTLQHSPRNPGHSALEHESLLDGTWERETERNVTHKEKKNTQFESSNRRGESIKQ